MLVMVECVCADDDVAALDMLAEQWTQDLRFRRVMPNAETTDARMALRMMPRGRWLAMVAIVVMGRC